MIRKGHKFVSDNTGESTPTTTVVLFNELNSTITTSFANRLSANGNSYPAIYYTPSSWSNEATVFHEYGHAINSHFGTIGPEVGGSHTLGIRYNPNFAFSEGWAHFFAAAVTNNSGIHPQFNLASNPPYSVSYGHYFNPVTPFEGVEDEVMVAALLWEMYSNTFNNYSYMHLSLKSFLSTNHKPVNIFEFIKNHRLYYDPGNGLGYWQRANQYLRMGNGLWTLWVRQAVATLSAASCRVNLFVVNSSLASVRRLFAKDVKKRKLSVVCALPSIPPVLGG